MGGKGGRIAFLVPHHRHATRFRRMLSLIGRPDSNAPALRISPGRLEQASNETVWIRAAALSLGLAAFAKCRARPLDRKIPQQLGRIELSRPTVSQPGIPPGGGVVLGANIEYEELCRRWFPERVHPNVRARTIQPFDSTHRAFQKSFSILEKVL